MKRPKKVGIRVEVMRQPAAAVSSDFRSAYVVDEQWSKHAVSKCDLERDVEIDRIRARLESLAAERRALEARLVELDRPQMLLPLEAVSKGVE